MDVESDINTGMFQQKIEDGFQKEIPEDWLRHINPLEIKREEYGM